MLVHNDAAHAQDITVRVIGLSDSDDPAIQAFLSDQPVTKEDLPPGGSAVADIPLGEPEEKVDDAAAASALIVASGDSGGLARRPLELSASTGASGNGGGAGDLSPAFAPDLTLTAVNYLPSPLAGLRSALLLLAALAAVIALAIRAGVIPPKAPQAPDEPRRRTALETTAWVVAGIATVVGLGWTAIARDWTPGPSLHAISARPVDVSKDVAPGVVGFVSSDSGSVARLEVDGGSDLRAQKLTSAASYEGVYDLAPSDDKAGAKATVNVKDWWLFAAVVIGLGVLLGLWLRNWYQRVRPTARLEIRLSGLLARAMSLQTSASVAEVDLGQVMGSKIAALVGRLRELIEDDDLAGAGKKLDELEAQLGRLISICDAVVRLAAKAKEMRALARQVGLEDLEVRLLAHADALIARAVSEIDLTALDADELKAKLATLADTSGLLARVGALYASGRAHRDRAVEMLRANPTDPRTREALQTLRTDFDEIMVKALQASSAAALDEVEKADDEKGRLLRVLAEDSFESPIGTVVFGVDMWPLPMLLDTRLRAAGVRAAALTGITTERLRPTAAITATVISADDSDRTIHLDDTVEFVAQISPWPRARLASVEFRYPDGTHHVAQVSPAGRATDYYPMTKAGETTVSVYSVPEGDPLGSEPFAVHPQTRRFAERLALKARDRDVARIAALLAVGSGLLSLYVSDPAWGATSDYLAAVLWGAVTGEGVKLAVAIADRVWPAGA